MPKETKRRAMKRAKRLKFPKSSVVKSKKGKYYITPRGIKLKSAKRAYAESRARGKSKSYSARIAHYVQRKSRRKNPVKNTGFEIYNNIIKKEIANMNRHVHDDAKRHAYTTLDEVNMHLKNPRIRNNKEHVQKLHAIAEHATNTLRNIEELERNDYNDDYNNRRYSNDNYNRTMDNAIEMINKILPTIADAYNNVTNRRKRDRYGRFANDYNDRTNDDTDDWDDDDYDITDRRGVFKGGRGRVDRRKTRTSYGNTNINYNDDDTTDKILDAYRRGHDDARRMNDRTRNDTNDMRNDRYTRNDNRNDDTDDISRNDRTTTMRR